MNAHIILASASKARAMLLQNAGILVEKIPADLNEDAIKTEYLNRSFSPKAIALKLAQEKALAVSRQHKKLTIGADQILQIDSDLISKCATLDEAKKLLQRLSGQTHYLHAGIALTRGSEIIWSNVETAEMSMRRLSDEFIDNYLNTEGEKLLACVGCYQLEGAGVHLFESIIGDYFTVLGLPLLPLLKQLRHIKVIAQ